MFLVTGATGALGRRIVRLLRTQDVDVRAFTRLTSRYGELVHRGAEIFIGDLSYEPDIQKSCFGVQYVISAHGFGGDALLDYRSNIQLIDHAKASGVQHFVFISVLGADRGYEDALVFKAKQAVEKYLIASGLNYTILRPSGLASNLLPLAEWFRETGIYLLIGDPKNRTSIVSTDNLARIAVDSVTATDARNQIFAVGGPEILLREDIPQIFSRIFSQKPILLNPPLFLFDGLRSSLVLFDQTQKALGTLRTLLDNEFFCTPEEIARLEAVFGLSMETLETFLRRYLAV
jgi:uncharacterized protein YbjT (DUF2867 family)